MTYEMYEALLQTLQQIRDRLPEAAMVDVEPLTIDPPGRDGPLFAWLDENNQFRFRPAERAVGSQWRKVYVEKLR